jgi:hypothetical protein
MSMERAYSPSPYETGFTHRPIHLHVAHAGSHGPGKAIPMPISTESMDFAGALPGHRGRKRQINGKRAEKIF